MAFNGSGTFVRLYNWVTDRDAATPITASRMDGEMDGMATGLSTCITKNGQTTVTAQIPFALGVSLGDGSASTPAVNFTADTNTGVYRSAADTLNLVAGGSSIAAITTTGVSITGTLDVSGALTPTGVIKSPNGSAAAPAVTFASDTDTGMYRVGADNLGFAIGGSKLFDISTSLATFTTVQVAAPGGAVGTPSFTFGTDTDTGIYRSANNTLAVTAGGSKVAEFPTTGGAITGTLSSTGNFTVNTDKFSVTASSGNVAFPGDLAINTDKFTVAGSSGNTVIAGTMSVSDVATFAKPSKTGKLTTSDYSNATTTLGDITGLSIALASGKTYHFVATLILGANASGGGFKVAPAYSSTSSAAGYNILSVESDATIVCANFTSMGSTASRSTANAGIISIRGGLTTTGAGNLTVQFALNAGAGTGKILAFSSLQAFEAN